MVNDPLEKFQHIWIQAQQSGLNRYRNSVCISTIDQHGFPNARFVDLKAVSDVGCIFCSDLSSAKAIEIQNHPKVSLTAWWEHVAYQIRIQGICQRISDQQADEFWQQRPREAQLTSLTFDQSQGITSVDLLESRFLHAKKQDDQQYLPRPDTWGGFELIPTKIEFLAFKDTRLHIRHQYIWNEHHQIWEVQLLQP